ncbi:MAG TPA: bacteriophage holin [Patescibacteria group bacterium]|nr:bacteriophage holin [Patescibacteria group bacterium]
MKHYYCDGGCKGVTNKPKDCKKNECLKYERELIECDCTDGKHGDDTPHAHTEHQDETHRLNPVSFGIAIGLALGIYFLFIGVTAWLFDFGTPIVTTVGKWYLGYSPTGIGSLLGLIWGFIDGFIGGFLIAWIYNFFQKIRGQ